MHFAFVRPLDSFRESVCWRRCRKMAQIDTLATSPGSPNLRRRLALYQIKRFHPENLWLVESEAVHVRWCSGLSMCMRSRTRAGSCLQPLEPQAKILSQLAETHSGCGCVDFFSHVIRSGHAPDFILYHIPGQTLSQPENGTPSRFSTV